jgi:hypothetical protein
MATTSRRCISNCSSGDECQKLASSGCANRYGIQRNSVGRMSTLDMHHLVAELDRLRTARDVDAVACQAGKELRSGALPSSHPGRWWTHPVAESLAFDTGLAQSVRDRGALLHTGLIDLWVEKCDVVANRTGEQRVSCSTQAIYCRSSSAGTVAIGLPMPRLPVMTVHFEPALEKFKPGRASRSNSACLKDASISATDTRH